MTIQPGSPISRNPYRRWFYIILIIAILLVIGVIYFYMLVRQNVDSINNSNQGGTTTFATEDDPSSGNPQAKIVIVEFADFECPFCFQAFPVVRQLLDNYSQDIYFVYRDFPIDSSHPNARKAAEAGECAQAQGRFWEMHDKMFLNHDNLAVDALKEYANEIGLDTELFNQCLDGGQFAAEVEQDFIDGLTAGVTGTPTFFINGRPFTGSITYDQFAQIIDQLKVLN
ncbi:MAG: DsbA family protein [Patescibacteria group bacterium]